MNTLNGVMLARFERLLAEKGTGGYRFCPTARSVTDPTNPRDATHDGVTHDRVVDGERILRAAADGATFCCGVTLELWWDGAQSVGWPTPATATDAKNFVNTWFCPTMGHSGAVAALVERGWGIGVEPREALPGDIVQFWRSVDLSRPSGHSAIVLGFCGDVLQYASSQRATEGLGIHEELVQPGWSVHIVRAMTRS